MRSSFFQCSDLSLSLLFSCEMLNLEMYKNTVCTVLQPWISPKTFSFNNFLKSEPQWKNFITNEIWWSERLWEIFKATALYLNVFLYLSLFTRFSRKTSNLVKMAKIRIVITFQLLDWFPIKNRKLNLMKNLGNFYCHIFS